MCAGAAVSLADRAESTPQEVFDGMRGSFQPAKAKGVHARYQWDLSGPTWWRMVDRGKRRDLQDGQGENLRSKCHFHSYGQGLGCHLPRPTQRHLGLFYRAAKGSRRPDRSQKAWRNVSLKFRFCRDPDVRRWICPLRLLNTEEIEISLDCAPCACNDLKRLETGVTDLQTGAILTVLNESVV